jgi:toxin-antitoxin system PIN domain toxin
MTFLLDVNLLFVLHQPLHPEYNLVNEWFLHRPDKTFATCPMTQSGMMRLLLQGVAGLDPFDMQEAHDALQHFVQQPGHVFWPDTPAYLDATKSLFARMQGHRQTTDAYLLGLAVHNHGKLATLDRGILHLAGKEFVANVEIIELKHE